MSQGCQPLQSSLTSVHAARSLRPLFRIPHLVFHGLAVPAAFALVVTITVPGFSHALIASHLEVTLPDGWAGLS